MTVTTRAIYFDMDGTIANLYDVEGWLNDLENYSVRPYAEALPLIRMQTLARLLNKLQNNGYIIGVVSWLSKTGTAEYNERVTTAKIEWLKKHLKSVTFDEINIVPYGTPKSTVVKCNGILFDDEERNRKEWATVGNNLAFDVDNIIEILKGLK